MPTSTERTRPLLVAMRFNSDVQLPYRMPISAQTHADDCCDNPNCVDDVDEDEIIDSCQNAQNAQPGSQQSATRSDTLAEGGARPVNAPPRPTGSEIVGAAGGTDASAAAAQSGNRGPGGAGMRQQGAAEGMPGAPGGSLGGGGSPAAGASAGGNAMGEAASADDTRTGTGTSSGHGTSVAGGDPSSGATPNPAKQGGGGGASTS